MRRGRLPPRSAQSHWPSSPSCASRQECEGEQIHLRGRSVSLGSASSCFRSLRACFADLPHNPRAQAGEGGPRPWVRTWLQYPAPEGDLPSRDPPRCRFFSSLRPIGPGQVARSPVRDPRRHRQSSPGCSGRPDLLEASACPPRGSSGGCSRLGESAASWWSALDRGSRGSHRSPWASSRV